MVRKPEIQYVGQFYVYGSEARALEEKPRKKQPRTVLPIPKIAKVEALYIDPVAIVGVAVAVVMLVVLLSGVAQINECWQEYDTMSDYLAGLRTENTRLTYQFHSGYDLATVESTALSLGMIPKSELPVVQLEVTVPQPEPEPTAWDDFVWFLSGLFA